MLVLNDQPSHGEECVPIGTPVWTDVVVWMKSLNLIVIVGVYKLRWKLGQPTKVNRARKAYMLRTTAAPASTGRKFNITSPVGPLSLMGSEYIATGITVLK